MMQPNPWMTFLLGLLLALIALGPFVFCRLVGPPLSEGFLRPMSGSAVVPPRVGRRRTCLRGSVISVCFLLGNAAFHKFILAPAPSSSAPTPTSATALTSWSNHCGPEQSPYADLHELRRKIHPAFHAADGARRLVDFLPRLK